MTIAVGTKVSVPHDHYPAHKGKDLYVMFVETFMDKAIGYGVGPAGNDPEKRHSTNGWLYYNAKHVTPAPTIKESTTLTTFTKGDRVEFIEDYDYPVKKGMQGTVVYSGGRGADVAVDGHHTVYVFTSRLKKVEPAVKAGDRVTVKGYSDSGTLFEGQTGTVEHTYPKSTNSTSARVQFDDAKVPDGTFDFKYLVPAPAPAPRQKGEFRIGDKVRVTKGAWTDPEWIGVEGIIEELPASAGSVVHKVKLTTSPKGKESRWPVGYIARLGNFELVEEPKPFTYADIQVGDTIKRTRTYKSGTVEVREGTVTAKESDYFADGVTVLAYESDDSKDTVTLELVSRPEPVKPEPELTDGTVKGDQIVIRNITGTVKVYTKQENGKWTTLVFPAGKTASAHRGFEWATQTINDNVRRAETAELIKA